MARSIEVPTAGYAFAQAPDTLTTIGVGSCLAICLYVPERKAGALIHCMLPRAGQHVSNPSVYVDTALNAVLEQFLQADIQPKSLIAKLVGGAEMFPEVPQTQTGDMGSIGKRNVEEATRLLEIVKIPVASKCVGGHHGRSLLFNLESGSISISTVSETVLQTI